MSARLVPDWVADRVRQPVPAGAGVVPGSTPVLSFGSPVTARIATLGLNPSDNEFVARGGPLLTGCNRRLASLASLGVSTLVDATDSVVAQVVADCDGYFQRRPYGRFFTHLESVIKPALGVSYWDGSACHLDLVQWATSPTWAHLGARTKEELVASDLEFLRRQLAEDNIRLVICNGKSVVNELWRLGVKVTRSERFRVGSVSAQMAWGAANGTTFIGWTPFRPTQAGSLGPMTDELVQRVRGLVAEFAVQH